MKTNIISALLVCILFLAHVLVHGIVNCPNENGDCDSEYELDLLVGTADGYLHAIDSVTNEKLWSVDTGGPLLSSFQQVRQNGKYLVL